MKKLDVERIYPNHGDPDVIMAGGYTKTFIDATAEYDTEHAPPRPRRRLPRHADRGDDPDRARGRRGLDLGAVPAASTR